MDTIKGRDIVIVGLQPWYFKIGNNAKNIAKVLAANNRVLYVNVPIKRKAFHARNPDPNILPHITRQKAGEDPIRELAHNLWEFYPPTLIESVNWLPSTRAFRILDYINNRRTARDIRKAIDRLGFRDIILFNDNDIYNGFYLKELLTPAIYIYYFKDFLQGFAYWKKHATVLEPELIRKVDIVVANSIYFAEYCGKINPRSYYIGQGTDFESFDPAGTAAAPEDIAGIPHPIIGYVGALNAERLNPEIIERLAKAQPAWNIVLVGPEDETFRQSSLHGTPNVHFLGHKALDELSAYVKNFDVCLNPQWNNKITWGNYPLKIDEYLAMGKPTVATRTYAMKVFEDHVYLADTPEEYEGLVKKALAEDSPFLMDERIQFARSHSWPNCVAEISRAVNDFEQNKKAAS